MKKITNPIINFFCPQVNSPKWRLDLKDNMQALYRSVLSACLPIVFQSLNAGSMVFDWKAISIAGVTGGLTYLTYGIMNGTNKKTE